MFFNYIKAFIYGAVQGITEFLPISSSGHLVILHKYLEIPVSDEVFFDVSLHLATLLAVLFFFRTDVTRLLSAWLKSFNGVKSDYSKIAWLIILSSIPAALVGLFFKDFIENSLRSVLVVSFMLVAVGLIFILIEKKSLKTKNLNALGWKDALFIGMAQAIALIPGTSRSGITIIAGLFRDMKREEAVRFSFLMSIPVILGAVILSFQDMSFSMVEKKEAGLLAASFLAAFLAAFFSIKYFLKFAARISLALFAYYRFFLAFIIIIPFFIKYFLS